MSSEESEVKFLGCLGLILLGGLIIFALPILLALGGAFCGFVVGLTPLATPILKVFSQVGLTAELWEIGATFGFAGGFIKPTNLSPKKED